MTPNSRDQGRELGFRSAEASCGTPWRRPCLTHRFWVVRPALWIGYAALFFVLGMGAWARMGGWWQEFVRGIRRGGWLTVGLVAAIGFFAAVSFWQFFALVHKLFFSGDSWLFQFSDTLIRLFPLPFWEIAFLFPIVLDVAGGLALGLGLRTKPK